MLFQNKNNSITDLGQTALYMLQVKIKFWLKFFNSY